MQIDFFRHDRPILSSVVFATAACIAVLILGCKKPEPIVLYCHCSPVFWNLMQEECAAFTQVYGNRIVMLPVLPQKMPVLESSRRAPALWRSRPQMRLPMEASQVVLEPSISHLISALSTDGRGDLFLTDSALQVESLENAALIAHRYPCCYLTLVLLVPKGNPRQIESVRGVLEKRLRLGIVDPGSDGSGLAALDIVSKTSPDLTEDLFESLICPFDRVEELLEALESGNIEAALAWNCTSPNRWLVEKYDMEYAKRFTKRIDDAKQRNDVNALNEVLDEIANAILSEKAFTETIELHGAGEQRSIEVALLSLSSSRHDRYSRRFADFLISPQGRKIMKKYGFVPKS